VRTGLVEVQGPLVRGYNRNLWINPSDRFGRDSRTGPSHMIQEHALVV